MQRQVVSQYPRDVGEEWNDYLSEGLVWLQTEWWEFHFLVFESSWTKKRELCLSMSPASEGMKGITICF